MSEPLTNEKIFYGMTKLEAIESNICIECRLPVADRISTDEHRNEYQISGMCGICFDGLFEGLI